MNDLRGNLTWFLNTLNFIDSTKKTEDEEIKKNAYKIAKTISTICESLQTIGENRNAIS